MDSPKFKSVTNRNFSISLSVSLLFRNIELIIKDN